MDFHETIKWQGLNVNSTKAPGSWKGKQPVGKMCSPWSDTAAVTPSNSMLSFSWTNKLFTERRPVCSAVMTMGKSQRQQRELTGQIGRHQPWEQSKCSQAHLLGSSVHLQKKHWQWNSWPVRGRLAKGWLVPKTSFMQASQSPVFYLILLAFELLGQNILCGDGERGQWGEAGYGKVAILGYPSGKTLESWEWWHAHSDQVWSLPPGTAM